MGRIVGPTPAVAVAIALVVLAGCGGSSKPTTNAAAAGQVSQASGVSATLASKKASAGGKAAGKALAAHSASQSAAARAAALVPAADVALVQHTPISKASFEHWLSVTAALSHYKHGAALHAALELRTLGFLITSQWVLAEAAHLGVGASEAEAHARLRQLTAGRYPTAAKLHQYLASVGESEADLLRRVRVELLESKIASRVTGGKTASAKSKGLLKGFQQSFEARWRRRTDCSLEHLIEDCAGYVPSGARAAAESSSSSSSKVASAGGANGASLPGASHGPMALSSPAFAPSGQLPSRYTCDGADISPPIRWTNLPAHTADLVLFILDDSLDGKYAGTRWIIAGIDPRYSGMSAGKKPPGSVEGVNSSGRPEYGGICPPKGKSATIEFVLWALDKKVPLHYGFVPSLAEHEFRSSELASAITYATYTRP